MIMKICFVFENVAKSSPEISPECGDMCNERTYNRDTNCKRCNDRGTQNAWNCYKLRVLRISLGHNPVAVVGRIFA